MPAPNEFPHHGRADPTCPTENEHPHDLPLLWKPAHRMARRRSKRCVAFERILRCSSPSQKSLKQNGGKKISLQLVSV
jgi:hypothetical protein